jgi:hypothetical protein
VSIIAPFLDAVTRWGEGRDDVGSVALVGSALDVAGVRGRVENVLGTR